MGWKQAKAEKRCTEGPQRTSNSGHASVDRDLGSPARSVAGGVTAIGCLGARLRQARHRSLCPTRRRLLPPSPAPHGLASLPDTLHLSHPRAPLGWYPHVVDALPRSRVSRCMARLPPIAVPAPLPSALSPKPSCPTCQTWTRNLVCASPSSDLLVAQSPSRLCHQSIERRLPCPTPARVTRRALQSTPCPQVAALQGCSNPSQSIDGARIILGRMGRISCAHRQGLPSMFSREPGESSPLPSCRRPSSYIMSFLSTRSAPREAFPLATLSASARPSRPTIPDILSS